MGMYVNRQIKRSRRLAAYLLTNTAEAIKHAEIDLSRASTDEARTEARDLLMRLQRSQRVLRERPDLLGPDGSGPFKRLNPLPELVLSLYADEANEATAAHGGSELSPGGTRQAWPSQGYLAASIARDNTLISRAVKVLLDTGLLEDTGKRVGDGVHVLRVADLVPAWEQKLDAAGVVLVEAYGRIRPPVPLPEPAVHRHTAWLPALNGIDQAGSLVEFDNADEFNAATAIKTDWKSAGGDLAADYHWHEHVRGLIDAGTARPVDDRAVELSDGSLWVVPAYEASLLAQVEPYDRPAQLKLWRKKNRAHIALDAAPVVPTQRPAPESAADSFAGVPAAMDDPTDDDAPAVPMPEGFREALRR